MLVMPPLFRSSICYEATQRQLLGKGDIAMGV